MCQNYPRRNPWKEDKEKLLKSIKEPIPASVRDAQAMAINKVFQRQAEKCLTSKNQSQNCTFLHDMEVKKQRIRDKCSVLRNLQRYNPNKNGFQKLNRVTSIDSANLLVLKYRY